MERQMHSNGTLPLPLSVFIAKDPLPVGKSVHIKAILRYFGKFQFQHIIIYSLSFESNTQF